MPEDESTNERSEGVQYWWNKMHCDMPKVVAEADRDCRFILNDDQSIICLQFDSERAVREVTFKFNKAVNVIETDMFYDHQHVSQELLNQNSFVFCTC